LILQHIIGFKMKQESGMYSISVWYRIRSQSGPNFACSFLPFSHESINSEQFGGFLHHQSKLLWPDNHHPLFQPAISFFLLLYCFLSYQKNVCANNFEAVWKLQERLMFPFSEMDFLVAKRRLRLVTNLGSFASSVDLAEETQISAISKV
jgi:hypothetical protein